MGNDNDNDNDSNNENDNDNENNSDNNNDNTNNNNNNQNENKNIIITAEKCLLAIASLSPREANRVLLTIREANILPVTALRLMMMNMVPKLEEEEEEEGKINRDFCGRDEIHSVYNDIDHGYSSNNSGDDDDGGSSSSEDDRYASLQPPLVPLDAAIAILGDLSTHHHDRGRQRRYYHQQQQQNESWNNIHDDENVNEY